MEKITYAQYMENPSKLHHDYYLQFVTETTKRYVLQSLTIEKIKNAIINGDKHLNEIEIPYNNMGSGGGWWWDDAPINSALLKELGKTDSRSTRTCVAKAAARDLANLH